MSELKIGFEVTESNRGDPHIRMVPETREHDTETLDCWCAPSFWKICGECDGTSDNCWACDDGTKEISHAEADWHGEGLMVVHRP